MLVRVTAMGSVTLVLAVMVAVLLCVSPAMAEGSASGNFPDRTFSVTRSTAKSPQADAFEVEILPQTSGEWWVTADDVAGSYITVSVWRNDAGSLVLETSSRLRAVGETSTKTFLTAGVAYRASFTQVGRPGTSVLREQFSWVRQVGSGAIFDVATDGSSVYASGFDSLPIRAFLRRFDSNGGEVWARHFVEAGTFGIGVALDGSGVYVNAFGTVERVVFLRKYDFDGNELWTRQFSPGIGDIAGGVSADGTGVYVAGPTDGIFTGQPSAGGSDVYLRKYDPDGNEMWTRLFGSSAGDGATAISADPSGIYVAGTTGGVLAGGSSAGGRDAFVAKYDSNGNAIWARQSGGAFDDLAFSIDVEGTGVYVAGRTEVYAFTDAFVRKYDTEGNEVWTRQFGTDIDDEARAVDVDGTGVYVAGWTDATLPGQSSAGFTDTFTRKYDPDGNEVWTRQFGTPDYDMAYAVEASGIYVVGNQGGVGFLMRLPR
jgi:hypothetical protein